MITYNSGADGHYLSKCNHKTAGLANLTNALGNGGTNTTRHVSRLPFQQLSDRAASANTFDNFPSLLMSMGKTSNDGTISIFTKDGITVHKEQDVLITCKGEPLLIGIRNSKGHYCILVMHQRGHWHRANLPKGQDKPSDKQTVSTTYLPSNMLSNGCMPYVGIPSKPPGLKQSRQAI